MSKRKADDLEPQSAESGDETPVQSPIVKKKPVPYAPLRHMVATANAFHMSTPAAPSARSPPSLQYLGVRVLRTPLPRVPCLPIMPSDASGDPFECRQHFQFDSESQETRASLGPKSNLGLRAGSASERHQETKEWIREAKQQQDEHAEQLKRTTEQFKKLFLTLREWDDCFHVALENRNSREQSELVDDTVALVLAPTAGMVLTNPPPTEEMSMCIKSALKNKPEPRNDIKDESAIKEHICASLYGMLGHIQQASDLLPWFKLGCLGGLRRWRGV